MTRPGYHRRGLCDGDTFVDVCTDPDCPVCSLWQRPGESHEAWLARIRQGIPRGAVQDGGTCIVSVQVISHMGSDEMVARAAWVSTQRDQREATPEAAEKLIRFLLSQTPAHASPFGHPHVTFLVECPIFVSREWMRHRVQTFSEVSSRYSDMSGEAYLPPPEDFRTQIGRPGEYSMQAMTIDRVKACRDRMAYSYDRATTDYRDMLALGLAREVARNVLPLGTMTRFYATASLRNWLGFLVLRNHPAALLEIRREAIGVEALLGDLFPVTMRIWTENGRPTL